MTVTNKVMRRTYLEAKDTNHNVIFETSRVKLNGKRLAEISFDVYEGLQKRFSFKIYFLFLDFQTISTGTMICLKLVDILVLQHHKLLQLFQEVQ